MLEEEEEEPVLNVWLKNKTNANYTDNVFRIELKNNNTPLIIYFWRKSYKVNISITHILLYVL